jgi:hypothetical protein
MRLVAGEHYFGLEASALRGGAQRLLVRIATMSPPQQRVGLRSLSEHFGVVGGEASTLLSALLAAGLLQPDGSGGYRPTALFKEYAEASVVTPLSRERARALLDEVMTLAARINSNWTRNPFTIESIAVSGSYMSSSDPVKDLLLWLMLRSRAPRDEGGATATLDPHEAMREIRRAIKAIDSFISVSVVPDRQSVPRPFAIAFQAADDISEERHPAPARSLGRTIATFIRKPK